MKDTSMSTGQTNAHFREHDIEFLQKRTKLWLETVLGETYGNRTLPELISDGNLLYRVSKHIIREMTGGSPGPQEMSPRTFARVSESGKNSGKYLPYANVDAFLKACRKVGLTDVELFNPSDAVEGKDIRPVCTCIRTLARKARAQHIRVPDFEDVNRPLPMRKEKVGEIKENLQHSHSSPVSPTVLTPDADIVKSERVQIIRRFLSATTNPLYVPEEDGASRSSSEPPSPATPGPFSTKSSPLFTPTATIGGIDTPILMKSVSAIEPSPVDVESAKSRFTSKPHSISSIEAKPDGALLTRSPSPDLPEDRPDDSPSPFSQKTLGSFRHAHPHFEKNLASQSNAKDLADDRPVKVADSHPEAEETLSSPAVSAPTTPAISSDHSADTTKEAPSLAQLGLGKAYRHASPHFSFKKSSETELTDSEDLQTQFSEEAATPMVSHATSKAPSSNKIVERDPRSTMQQTEVPGKPSLGPATTVPAKNPAGKPEAKAPGMQLNPRHWMPLVAGALAFVGTILVVRSGYNSTNRESDVYEVQEGDTLSTISKRVGKKSWDELVRLNPSISNPDLIYPSERLKLSSE